jgi:hypothetical protein
MFPRQSYIKMVDSSGFGGEMEMREIGFKT